MAQRTRGAARLAWWTAIAALGAAALYAGTWRLWALTVLVWAMYELCFCPTTCSVAIRDGTPCRNGARGRLYACTNVAAHQRLKTDALWHLTGRLRLSRNESAAHRKAPLNATEQGSVEPGQRLMTYLAVLVAVALIVPTAVGLASW
jgi:hypothetical protein